MDHILETAYMRAYMPFFLVLKEYPKVKVNLHFSGYLLDWLLKHKPEYIALLRELRDRGQIEMVSGGMYEPILALVPEEDGVSQIRMHQTLVEETFGERPRGAWLAERVYEPQIPKLLSRAGVAYTLVDDNHFKSVGLEEHELYGYYLTEFEGYPLNIFPGLEQLRYMIPFRPVSDLDSYLKGVERIGGDLVVFGDDGEKFGLWPGTSESVYGEGWLKSFFDYLTANISWLSTVTFSEYMTGHSPKGRIYLDCQSYKEMGGWALPASLTVDYDRMIHEEYVSWKRFLKGGYYRHFLVKYQESNDMHKKMLRLSKAADGNEEAKKQVYMAQANDSYWHGVFGGLYLPHLRASVYRCLIEAQKILDPQEPFVEAFVEDINFDGCNEVVLRNDKVEASLFPKEGGVLYGLDHKPTAVNVMATLQRRYEGYHEKIREAMAPGSADGTKTIHDLVLAKEKGLEKYLNYDWYRRASFVDHVMGMDVDFESFRRCAYHEPGDFVKELYETAVEKSGSSVCLDLSRKGHFWKGSTGYPLIIRKRIILCEGDEGLDVIYRIEGDPGEPFLLGIEFNLALLGSGGDRYLEVRSGRYPLTTADDIGPSETATVHDPYQGVEVLFSWDVPQRLWTFPVEVVSLSEEGFERNYQSTMIMPVWSFGPSPDARELRIRMGLQRVARTF